MSNALRSRRRNTRPVVKAGHDLPPSHLREAIANATHRVVCEIFDERSAMTACLFYTGIGCLLARAICKRNYVPQGGSLLVPINEDGQCLAYLTDRPNSTPEEFHSWICCVPKGVSGEYSGPGELVDLSSRHFFPRARICGQEVTLPDLPPYIWTRSDGKSLPGDVRLVANQKATERVMALLMETMPALTIAAKRAYALALGKTGPAPVKIYLPGHHDAPEIGVLSEDGAMRVIPIPGRVR